MAYLWAKYLGLAYGLRVGFGKSIVCSHNEAMFQSKTVFHPISAGYVATEAYDVVVLCSTEQTAKGYYELAARAARVNGHIIHYTTPREQLLTNFFHYNWKNLHMHFPSPRHPDFSTVFRQTVEYAPHLELALSYKRWPISRVNEAFEHDANKHSFCKSYIRMVDNE
jgi:hypothetical protein